MAANDGRPLSKILRRGSPAAELDRILGPAGFCRIVGMSASEEPERFVAEARGDVISGALLDSHGTECPYHISCVDVQVTEVLPFPPGHDGALWGFYWWDQRPRASGRIVAPTGLDPVKTALATLGTAWNGLPVAARAPAAWGRIAADHQRLLSAHPPVPLAAAVHRLVTSRADGRTTFAEAAAAFCVPEPDVRRADRAVRAPLALGPGQPW